LHSFPEISLLLFLRFHSNLLFVRFQSFEIYENDKYTVKKVSHFPVPSLDVTYQTLPQIIAGQGPSDIPAADGKMPNPFLTVYPQSVTSFVVANISALSLRCVIVLMVHSFIVSGRKSLGATMHVKTAV
jgi:hypothetical protein